MHGCVTTIVRSSVVTLTGVVAAIGATMTPASATHLSLFSGVATGEWGLPEVPTESTFVTSVGTGSNNRIEWGLTDCPTCTPFTNYVQFEGKAFATRVGTLFSLGTLSYRNASTYDGFEGDFPLTVTLGIMGRTQTTQSFQYLFNVLNTTNVTGDPVVDGDRLRFTTTTSDQIFSVRKRDYRLRLVGFSTDNGATLVREFNSPESTAANDGPSATADLFAMIEEVVNDVTEYSEICPPDYASHH